ncbi:ABC transporter ATP-binding protein [Arcanobacterium phocae]|uniref:ABC transporter ATP-binding protein n=1 Tax=Arcanobacterium phocae TaxID=131112 RepID=UPI001C0E9548|nr:ATP-binding cassette domain-containing protein [Arcanobacterium phocae]
MNFGILSARCLTKKYGDTNAIEDVSFHVKKGGVTALLGPNGAGKSTIMRVLCGLEEPTSGAILFDGEELLQNRAVLGNIGTMLDPGWLDRRMTPEAVLRYRYHLVGKSADREAVDRLLRRVGLESARRKRIVELSLGMKQRLHLAASIVDEPSVLVMDEPVNGLDPEGVQWVRNFLLDFARNGGSVLISSHLIGEIELVASEVVIVNKGRVRYAGPIDSLRSGNQTRVEIALNEEWEGMRLSELLTTRGIEVTRKTDKRIIASCDALTIANIALDARIPLVHLSEFRDSLEDSYFRLLQVE